MNRNSRSGAPVGDFQLGFPFKSAVGYIGIGERLITRGMKGKKVCYVKVRMADEIADLAKCFLLALCS